jgi:hypothetical protein
MRRFPFVWLKTAEADIAGWKAEANRQRKRAERAEGVAAAEVRVRRRVTALYADLHDEYEAAIGPLLTAPPSKPFTADRARQTAARIASVRAHRARPYASGAQIAEEATA